MWPVLLACSPVTLAQVLGVSHTGRLQKPPCFLLRDPYSLFSFSNYFAFIYACLHAAFCMARTVKNLPPVQETRVGAVGLEDPLQKGMAPQCSILAWEIPWTEEPGWATVLGSQGVRHDSVTNTFTLFSVHTCMPVTLCHDDTGIKPIVPCTGNMDSQPLDCEGSPPTT